MNKFASRRWMLTVFFAVASTVALFTGVMTDVLYVSVVTTILGIYAGAGTYEKVKANVSKSD